MTKRLIFLFLLCLFVFRLPALENYPGSIRQVRGTPTLFIGDKPVFASALRVNIEDGTVADILLQQEGSPFQQFSAAGVPVVFLGTNAGWLGIGKYDFRFFDTIMDKLLRDAPNAYVIPSIFLYRATWFGAEFPDEAAAYLESNGKRVIQRACPSFFSRKFEATAKDALTAFVRHAEERGYASRILGYQINFGATAEWQWWDASGKRGDVSPCALEAWQRFLQNRYPSIQALNAAHRSAWQSFDTIEAFSKTFWTDFEGGFIQDAVADAAKKDYCEMVQLRQTELKRSFCGHVKRLTGNKALLGLYNYFDQAQLDGAPEIDFTVSSCIYTDRAANGVAVSQARQLEHLRRTGKLYFHDADMRTCLWESNPWYSAFNLYDSIMMMRREFGTMLAKGAGNTWFSLNVNRNVYDNPEIMRTIAQTEAIGNAAIQCQYDLSSNAQIAFVFDRLDQTGFWGQYCFYTNYGRLGASVDFFPAHRLDLIGPQYKLIILASPPTLDLDALQRLKTQGRTILFLYCPGMNGKDGLTLANATAASGFHYRKQDGIDCAIQIEEPFRNLFGDSRPELGKSTSGPRNTFRLSVLPEDGVEILGRAPDGSVTFARKRYPDWTAIFFANYQMHADWLQILARQAGVTIYDNSVEASFYRNRHFWCISADADGGDKCLLADTALPALDIFSGTILEPTDGKYVLKNLRPFEVRLLLTDSRRGLETFLTTYRRELATRQVPGPARKLQVSLKLPHGTALYASPGKPAPLQVSVTSDKVRKNIRLHALLPTYWKCPILKAGDFLPFETKEFTLLCEPAESGHSDRTCIVAMDDTGHAKASPGITFQAVPYTCLSDLPWQEASTGWGTIHLDTSCLGCVLKVGGSAYEKGIGVHAPSRIVYALDGKQKRLSGVVGIDALQQTGGNGIASAIFVIKADGKELFRSPTLIGGGPSQPFSVNLQGAHTIELIVDNAGDGSTRDHADWCNLHLE